MDEEAGGGFQGREHVQLDPSLLRIHGNNVRTGQDNAFSSGVP
jgi:hypothetical protein